MRRKTFTTFTLFLAVAAAAGSGDASAQRGSTEPPTSTPSCRAGAVRRVGSAKLAYAAVVKRRATVARRPGGPAFASFGRLNQNGVAMIFAVRAKRVDARCRATAFLVQVPQRPNGVTGWVPARQVLVARVRTRIVVDLSQKRVMLYRDGKRVLTSVAAVGSRATPTPTGSFYVNQRLIPTDPRGPFGPGAVGISAFSDVLTGWAQGGPIAIHGTNEPWSIGKAVSNGCIRLPNPVLRKLFRQTLNGTPVVIRR